MFIEELTEEKLQDTILLYGPAASGKTTACLSALSGRSVYISTNKNFNVERLAKLNPEWKTIVDQLLLFEPKNLIELEKAISAAVQMSSLVSVIIVDSIATYARVGNKTESNLALNRMLKELHKAQCLVIITSEVYDYLRESRHEFVGGDILRLTCRTIIELNGGQALVKKHPVHSGRSWHYEITDEGLKKIE